MLLENLGRLGEAPAAPSPRPRTSFASPRPRAPARARARRRRRAAGARRRSGRGRLAGSRRQRVRGLHRFSLCSRRSRPRVASRRGRRLLAAARLAAPSAAEAPPLPAAQCRRGRTGRALPPGASEALAFAARSSHSGGGARGAPGAAQGARPRGRDRTTCSARLSQTLPGWVMPTMRGGIRRARGAGVRRARRDAPHHHGHRGSDRGRKALPGDGAAGIERFNEGSLPQAVSMLELAERLLDREKGRRRHGRARAAPARRRARRRAVAQVHREAGPAGPAARGAPVLHGVPPRRACSRSCGASRSGTAAA